ncbi:hypothetical protein CDAR_316671 [Caerostris darwini]|uniref:Uncharacterized protein n=1 Tax=Caerostris darwini TaxID=1538125 RepID=A0AAV4UJG4_9ARAC|nr:hypothetical protein CDAR_316671 [Caerostris darwini]
MVKHSLKFHSFKWPSLAINYLANLSSTTNDFRNDTHLYSTPYKLNPIPYPNDFKGCVGGDSWMNRSQWGARHVLRGCEKEGVYPLIIRTKGSMRKSSIRREGGVVNPLKMFRRMIFDRMGHRSESGEGLAIVFV